MKNLSQIPESELIIVKYKEGMTEVIEAGEIASCIAYNEGYNLEFFTAVKDAVQINERELITTLTVIYALSDFLIMILSWLVKRSLRAFLFQEVQL